METKCNDITLAADGYYYINDHKITGVAMWRRENNDFTRIYKENRVVMTHTEQEKLGSNQPFMLPRVLLDNNGNVMPISTVQKEYMQALRNYAIKANSKKPGKRLGYKMLSGMMSAFYEGEHSPPHTPCQYSIPQLEDNEKWNRFCQDMSQEYYWAAVIRGLEYSKRHFIMPILREALKQGETPKIGLLRLLEEETRESLLQEYIDIKHTFVYYRSSKRSGNTAQLVYFISNDMVVPNNDAIIKQGKSNYFCAKSISSFGNNDYLEVKSDPQIVQNKHVLARLEDFNRRFGSDGLGGDLSRWGAISFWKELLKHIQ